MSDACGAIPYFIYYRVRRENHLIEVMDFGIQLGWNRTSDLLCIPLHLERIDLGGHRKRITPLFSSPLLSWRR